MKIPPSSQTLITSPSHITPLIYIFFTISGVLCTYDSFITPYSSLKQKKLSLGSSWFTLQYLRTQWNLTPWKLGEKKHELLRTSTPCLLIQPQDLLFGEYHGRYIIGISLSDNFWGIDRPCKERNNSTNEQNKHTSYLHSIIIDFFTGSKIHMCNLWAIKKFPQNSQLYMHHKSQLSFRESDFYSSPNYS